MAVSTNTTTGVKAIKVSKTDALGNDQTLILQEGELLTLVFDDIGTQRFTITSVSEYSDYYLYYVIPALLGINESDFHVPEDVSGTGTGVINAGNYELQGTGGGLVQGKRFADFATVDNLTSWNFTNSTGRLTSILGLGGNRFALTIQYQVEVYTNATTSDSYTFAIAPEGSNWDVTYNNDVVSSNSNDIINGNTVTLVAPTNGVGNARSITGSFNIVADAGTVGVLGIKPVSYYGAAKFFFPTGSINIDIQSFISGSSDNNGVNTIVEPYITENFAINDYNATINNAVEARDNEFYMDVDYSSNAIVAVNSDTILDDTATRAKVQYSNYTSERVTRPRYDGSKNESPDFNVGYENQLPVVESEKVYFAYFDWIGGSAYGRLSAINPGQGQANVHVLLLIDEKGNTYQPSISGSYYTNLITTFNANGNRANVIFRNTPTNAVNDISGVHNVIAPGAITLPLLFSQTGSESGVAVDPISFEDLSGGGTIPAYSGSVVQPLLQTVTSGDIGSIQGANFTPAAGNIKFTAGSTREWEVLTTNTDINLTPSVTLEVAAIKIGGTYPNNIVIYFDRKEAGSSTYVNISQHPKSLPNATNFTFTETAGTSFPAVNGDKYRVRVGNDGPGESELRIFANTTVLAMNQSPQAAPSNVSSPYWTTGSSSTFILTGSKFTDAYINGRQTVVTDSGYSDPITFNPQIGDEIRFGANERNVYQIIDVSLPNENSDGELFLTLNAPITTGTDLDSFLLRRYSPNPNFVLIQTDSGGGDGDGFLLPEFVSPELESRFNEIIEDLEEKGII